MKALWRCHPVELPLDTKHISSGAAYRPILFAGVHNTKGTGESIPGLLNGRAYQVLSQLEMKFFHLAHLNPYICDIREQYPACSDTLFAIMVADSGYRPTRREVPTLDFVLTLRGEKDEDALRYVAINIKNSSELADPKVLRRFHRELEFCEGIGWPWYLVTERDIPLVAAENARKIYYWIQRDELSASASEAEAVGDWLCSKNNGKILINVLMRCSRALGLPKERMPHLLATACYLNILQLDMRERLDLRRPLHLSNNVSEVSLEN